MFKKLLRSRLLASVDVSYSVSSRVYPVGEIPQGPTLPYIFYEELGLTDEARDTQGRGGLLESSVRVVTVAESYTDAQVLAGDVRTALHHYKGTGEGETIAGIFLQDTQDDVAAQANESESPLHLVIQEYSVWHRQ